MAHPVSLRVQCSPDCDRVQVVIRLALLAALGAIGHSSVVCVAYLAVPPLVALRIQQKGGSRYLAEDGPRITAALRWLAGAYGYLWLLTDDLPTSEGGAIRLGIESDATPTTRSALARLIWSLPALMVGLVLSLAAVLVWIAAVVCALVERRVPAAIADFLTAVLRFQVRLFAYHLSLVARYPIFDTSIAPEASGPSAA
jgi:hypothetical protein